MAGRVFYQAPGARTGDVIPKYIDGAYQLFYLKGWKDPKDPKAVFGWHRLEGRDLLHFGEETPIGVRGGTGDLIQKDGQWHLFSCIFPQGRQLVTHYISSDNSLDHWTLQQEDTFGADGVIYDPSDWRDPRIVWRKDLGEYWMFLAARARDCHGQTGCVGLCVSRDLKKWEYRRPVYYPQRFGGACECPDFFRMGDWYYLVFSSYTTLFGTYYVKCRAGENRWQIPANHRLDGRAFYAAKTAGDGQERYLFGWNPTKEQDLFGFWPNGLKAQDYRTWDWGGSLVIHKLTQLSDGDLALSMPENRRDFFRQCAKNRFFPLTGGWAIQENRYEALSEENQQMALMQPLPELFYLRVDLRVKKAQQAGIVLRTDREMKEGYYLYLEPERGRLVYRSWLRMSEEGGKTFPYDVEQETPVRRTQDGLYRMEILAEGSAAVAYVNGEAALSLRMYDRRGESLGLFSFGSAVFENVRLMQEAGERCGQ